MLLVFKTNFGKKKNITHLEEEEEEEALFLVCALRSFFVLLKKKKKKKKGQQKRERPPRKKTFHTHIYIYREREMGEGGVRLPPRASRGRRMTRMLEDEDSADEEFWNQDAFKEEQNDEAYESEEEVADVFDADFDEEESDEDEEEEVEVEKERRKKAMKAPERRTTLATKKKRKEKMMMMMLGSDERGKKEGNDGEEKKEATTATAMTTTETVAIPRELRLSSRASAKEIREKSEQLRREREARPQITRPKVEYVVPTMEEMIKEAKITERKNLIELEYLLHLEEEQKKKNQMMDRKKRYDGPAIRQRSLKGDVPGKIVYELIRGATCERDAPEFYLKGEQHRKNEDKICAITGLPAKYRDPKSGSYYATIDAFKQLRLQQEKKEAEEKEKEKENAEADVPVKMEDEQQQKQKQKQEQPKRASIWDPPVPGALTHRELAQMAKRKAEKEEQAAMQAFLKEQEEAKAALRGKKQGKTAAAAKIVPRAKRTKAQIKKAYEAMKREEEANRNLRGPGRWLSMKTILSRPELDVPTVGNRHPRPVLQGFSKPGIPKYVVATPQSVGERPLEEEVVKIEQPNFDTGDDGGTTVATAGHDSPNMRHIDSCDIMTIDDNNEDDALTNSDDFTAEDASEDDVDDEETIEEDERAALEEDDARLNLTAEEERNALEDEANIPIEELVRRYQANNRRFGQKEPSPSPENSSDFDRDDLEDDDSGDNESTLEEDEKALQEDEDMLDADEEQKRLEDEANMPIEELLARYRQQQP